VFAKLNFQLLSDLDGDPFHALLDRLYRDQLALTHGTSEFIFDFVDRHIAHNNQLTPLEQVAGFLRDKTKHLERPSCCPCQMSQKIEEARSTHLLVSAQVAAKEAISKWSEEESSELLVGDHGWGKFDTELDGHSGMPSETLSESRRTSIVLAKSHRSPTLKIDIFFSKPSFEMRVFLFKSFGRDDLIGLVCSGHKPTQAKLLAFENDD